MRKELSPLQWSAAGGMVFAGLLIALGGTTVIGPIALLAIPLTVWAALDAFFQREEET
jgi:hypothetical protein